MAVFRMGIVERTWPTAPVNARGISASVADGQENFLPAAAVVAPLFRVQDQRSLRCVRHDEAVRSVMNLTAISATLYIQLLDKRSKQDTRLLLCLDCI